MSKRYTTEEVRVWSPWGKGVVDAEIHEAGGEDRLIVALLEPLNPNDRELQGHRNAPPYFQVMKPDLVRICRQILREIDPTPEEQILQELQAIRQLWETKQ